MVAFGTLGMLAYPHVAPLLFHSSAAIGTFIGVAIHDTSQVMGAALTYDQLFGDEVVLKVAAITKLSRNTLLAAVVPYLSWREQQQQTGASATPIAAALDTRAPPASVLSRLLDALRQCQKYIPTFVLAFLGAALLRSLGDAQLARGRGDGDSNSDGTGGGADNSNSNGNDYGNRSGSGIGSQRQEGLALFVFDAKTWREAYTWASSELGGRHLLGTAMAAVGLSTRLADLRGIGAAPFAVGLGGALAVALSGYLAIVIVGRVAPHPPSKPLPLPLRLETPPSHAPSGASTKSL